MPSRLAKLPWMEIAILLLAVALRVALLDIKPPHFDEGVNGWFADQMRETGFFRYDPTNYHGPLHFYAVFLSQTLFGRNLWALRLPAIVASLLCVWALLRYREFFGATAARLAALAMAVSPAFVFYGRYSIHESWMVFFCITFLWAVLGLWEKGERRFLFALVFAGTGMIVTKETYVLHLLSFVLAAGVLWLWQMVLPSRPALRIARQSWTGANLGWSLGVAALAIVFFYSGNFLHFEILQGLYQTYEAWFKTGVSAAGHEKKIYQLFGREYLNYYWLYLMARYEWPALAGFVACFRYIGPSDARLRYVAIYAGGVLLAFSEIPYKTPWCIISLIWPFYLVLGALVAEMFPQKTKKKQQPPQTAALAATITVLALIAVSFYQSLRLNFRHFEDEKEPYVYVQTHLGVNTLTEPLLTLAKKDPRYYQLRGQILLDSYYPLPWMLGDFTQIGYQKELPTLLDGDFIVAANAKAPEIEKKLAEPYYKRVFQLRDGMEDCVVYFRQEPFAGWFKTEPEITPSPTPGPTP